jgi:carbohydrate-selective porin OprB
MKIRPFIRIVVILIVIFHNIEGQDTSRSVRFIEPHINYIVDLARNFNGGIKKGNSYIGLIDAGLIFNFDRFWKGGSLIAGIQNTHGSSLSCDLTGDLQVLSNIENGNFIYFSKLAFTQKFMKKGYFTIGLYDLNIDFATSEYGVFLSNSSYGIPSIFSLNLIVPLYPKTVLSALINIPIGTNFSFRSGIFDGNAGSLDDVPHNLDWSIQNILFIEEFDLQTDRLLHTSVKIGGYYQNGDFINTFDSLQILKGDYGFYLIADKELFEGEIRRLSIFGQIAFTPKDRNYNYWYTGIGLNLFSPIGNRPDDGLSIECAVAGLYDHQAEYSFECNYFFYLNKYLSFQPVFHYIINPGGANTLSNAFAGCIRFYLGI